MKVIEVEGIEAGYGKEIVLRDFSWTVERPAFWAVLGPNGSGKTTLLRILMGALKPSKGRVRILGREISSYGRKELARTIAVLLQGEFFPVDFTVEEYLLLGRYPYLRLFSGIDARDRETLERVCELTDTCDLRKKGLFSLSSGEFQRVRVARALLQEPSILALDEPTVHLDVDHVFSLMGLLRDLADSGLTVIAVLHDLNIALDYADNGLLLERGRARVSGGIREVLSPKNVSEVFRVRALLRNGHLKLEPAQGRP